MIKSLKGDHSYSLIVLKWPILTFNFTTKLHHLENVTFSYRFSKYFLEFSRNSF